MPLVQQKTKKQKAKKLAGHSSKILPSCAALTHLLIICCALGANGFTGNPSAHVPYVDQFVSFF